MTKNVFDTLRSAIEDLEDELQEAKSIIESLDREKIGLIERQDSAQQSLSIAKSNVRFLKIEAPIVSMERYRESLKLIQDNLKSLKWLGSELQNTQITLNVMQSTVENLEKDLNKHKNELKQWGRIYHYPKR
jgi:hypothetical protein